MPELPEVETTKAGLQPLIGQTVQSVTLHQSQLRWPVPDNLNQLIGQSLCDLSRRSKYIIATFTEQSMLWHLGMSGSFRLTRVDEPVRKHDHVMINFTHHQLRYHDPRRFGCMLWLDDSTHAKLLQPLGPEPLTDAFNVEYLHHALKNKKVAIKVALMDNHVVVGVGNIYATECLFQCGIHPAQPANQLTEIQLEKLVEHIKLILTRAITLGGSTLRDYVNSQGEAGYFQQTLLAYGRAQQPCVICDTPLAHLKLGQRASVYCSNCQPLIRNA